MKIPFQTRHAVEVSGLKRNTFDDLHRRGIIRPTVRQRGRGNPARYSFNDLVAINLTRKLATVLRMDQHLAADMAEKICNALTEGKIKPDLDTIKLEVAVDAESLKWGEVEKIREKSDMYVVIDIIPIMAEVKAKAEKLEV